MVLPYSELLVFKPANIQLPESNFVYDMSPALLLLLEPLHCIYLTPLECRGVLNAFGWSDTDADVDYHKKPDGRAVWIFSLDQLIAQQTH